MKLSITAAKTYLRIALLIAVLPIISIIVGAVATKTGLLDWKLGFGLLTFRGPPMIAMLSVATGVIGLVVALLAPRRMQTRMERVREWKRGYHACGRLGNCVLEKS